MKSRLKVVASSALILSLASVFDAGQCSAADSDEPTVAGFGQLETVPGFGPEVPLEELYEERTLEYVDQRILELHDSNRNGLLDRSEVARVPWGDPPEQDDKNRDGCLTRKELADRTVRRWGRGKKPLRSVTAVPGFGVSNPGEMTAGSASGPVALEERYEEKVLEYVKEQILEPYDTNHNGVLETEEIRRGRWGDDPMQDDKNGDGTLSREELCARVARRWNQSDRTGSGDSAGHGPDSRGPSRWPDRSGDSRSESSQDKSSRLLTPTERLPEGLPDWFARRDLDGDGQVAMSEFSSEWSDDKAAEFRRYDPNGDGIITPEEALRSEEE
ncbi:MAG TPA: EF-hand domain-containing protein [Thermoguttaceae bacterium]|nr:EF-hand domain-containing protein [Thermoguttaceae bacterium]